MFFSGRRFCTYRHTQNKEGVREDPRLQGAEAKWALPCTRHKYQTPYMLIYRGNWTFDWALKENLYFLVCSWEDVCFTGLVSKSNTNKLRSQVGLTAGCGRRLRTL